MDEVTAWKLLAFGSLFGWGITLFLWREDLVTLRRFREEIDK